MRATVMLAASISVAAILFVAGFASAFALMAKPATQALANLDVPDLWTFEPKRVDAAKRPGAPNIELVATADLSSPAVAPSPVAAEAVRTQDAFPVEPQLDAGAVNPDHQSWCERRYRSYRVEDNSYSAYSGERRACVSPHMDVASSDGFAQVDLPPSGLDSEHAARCSARYASYRLSDNTYQPFSGPRRACVLD